MFNLQNIKNNLKYFSQAQPFNYCIVDNFLPDELAKIIENEFPHYDYEKWWCYNNRLENKKSICDWNEFKTNTYKVFNYLMSKEFVDFLSSNLELTLYADSGLHGGGLHCHGQNGNLNPHLDYSIHPKLGLQRKLNIIIYVSSNLKEEHGGHLGLWSHDDDLKQPGKLEKEVQPLFNRAIIFDTTQNSWHGMSRPLTQPNGIYRKSLAAYYLCEPPVGVDKRGKALYAPREEQKNDADIYELIKMRSDVEKSNLVYKV